MPTGVRQAQTEGVELAGAQKEVQGVLQRAGAFISDLKRQLSRALASVGCHLRTGH